MSEGLRAPRGLSRRAEPTALSAAVGACRRAFLGVGLFSGVINLLMLTVPVYTMQLFDRVLASRSIDTLSYLTLLALGALLLLAALDALRSRMLARCSAWLEQAVGPEAFARGVESAVMGAPYTGQALRDLSHLRGFVGGTGIVALFDAPWVPVYVAVVFLLHPVLGWIAVGAAVLLLLLAVINELATRAPLRAANTLATRNFQRTDAALRNALVIDAMGMLPNLLRRWQGDSNAVLAQQEAAGDRGGGILAVTKFVRLAVQVVVMAAGAYLALQQEITGGAMIAASIVLGRALAPLEQAMGSWRQLVGARQSFTRLQEFLQAPPLRTGGMRLPAPSGALAVEQVTFGFPGVGSPALRNVSFSVEPGESLAVIGPSASGKTTLSRLLVGTLKPTLGTVRLDGADIFSWPREDVAQHIGYLPQDVELFAGSVRDNIARLGEADPEAVVEAARLANCHEMILRLPNGYDTEIGEAGAFLSGGQRQLVGLARALCGAPKLVVLDEPNSNLDTEGDQALAAALRTLKQRGTTVVMICHRPSLVQYMDKVLFLRDGQIELFGPRDEVLAQLAPRAVAPNPVGRLHRSVERRVGSP